MPEENPPPVKWVKSAEGVTEFYANMVHIMWSLDDVRIRIGQLVDSPETPNPGPGFRAISEESVAITCSWRNAKILRDNLSTVIAAYEEVNGEINLTPKLPQA